MGNRTDDFNRADTTNNIGTPSDGGSAWSQLSGTWGISSNQAYTSVSTSQAVCVLESSLADVDVQYTVNTYQQNNSGLIARSTDNSNYLLCSVGSGGTGTDPYSLIIYKRVSGSFTSLGSNTYTHGTDTVKFSVNGSSLIGYINGVSKVSVSDSFNSTATKHGMRNDTDVSSVARFDTFSITGIGGGVTLSYPLLAKYAAGVGLVSGGVVR